MNECEPTVCPRCGRAHERCAAHNRQGGPCGRPPMHGQRVCVMHGGKTPAALVAAERRQQEAALAASVVTYGLPVDTSPEEALLEEVRRTAGHVAWLGLRVRDLEARDLSWGVTEEIDRDDLGENSSAAGHETTYGAKPPVVVELYRAERKHLVDVCKAAISAGIEERRVALAERYGEQIVAVLQAVRDAAELGLSAAQVAVFDQVAAAQLRAIGGGR